jgi:hypothetical protein
MSDLRTAIADLISEPGESGWRVALELADAILALPEMVAALEETRLLRAFFDVYWNQVGLLDPPDDLVGKGYASLLTIEDARLLDAAAEAVDTFDAARKPEEAGG